MKTINERIRFLRKELGLSQTEFGENVGVGLGVIRNIELGRTDPKDLLIKQIERVYGASGEWMRYGTGDMFKEKTDDEMIAKLACDVLSDDFDEIKKKLILMNVQMISKMSDEAAKEVVAYMKKPLEEQKKEED